MLTGVTITGADDKIDPKDLASFSLEFPFVEWGILFSSKREGSPRYPSAKWVERLTALAHRRRMSLSAHYCGERARELLRGEIGDGIPVAFQRAQLNGYSPPNRNLLGLSRLTSAELILQVRSEADLRLVAEDVHPLGNRASCLYDPSGGRGVEVTEWPAADSVPIVMGLAGGIRPELMRHTLYALGDRGGPFWIDFESGARDQWGHFDLRRVRLALEVAAPFVAGEAP